MNRGVIFMAFGRKHAAHLCVAVASLRNHYDGPVAIIHDAEAEPLCRAIVDQDPCRSVQLVSFTPFKRAELGTGSGYLNKTRLIELSPFVFSVFLDCDTAVVGSIDKMFPEHNEVRVTQFSDWVTTGNKMHGRIMKWKDADPGRVGVQLAFGYPALNTGVMGLSKFSTKLSETWREVCEKNVSFMCDELAMQLVFLEFPHVVLPDYYNCSPVFSINRRRFDRDAVKVWHFHGMKSIRHPEGLSLWLPFGIQLWSEDRFGIREAFQHNKYFRMLAADPIKHVLRYGRDRGDQLIQQFNITDRTFAQ